jgi:PhzF family phenazine biosynthesis protein
MGLPDPAVEDWADPSPAFAALGLPAGAAAPGLPAVRCGFYSLVPVRGLAALHGIRPDLKSVAAVTASQGGDGLIVVSLETVEPSSAVHVRMFAPAAGVDEDPVTGSAQGAVAGWLARIGYLGGGPPVPARVRGLPGGRVAYTAEQGDVLSRPGRIDVELTVDETAAGSPRARDVAIIGRAVTVMEGTIRVG